MLVDRTRVNVTYWSSSLCDSRTAAYQHIGIPLSGIPMTLGGGICIDNLALLFSYDCRKMATNNLSRMLQLLRLPSPWPQNP